MKIFSKFNDKALLVVLAVVFALGLGGLAHNAYAAQAAVSLGTADSFAILAGTPNITNVPTSVITGNVGLSPATGAGIGLTQAEVTGTIYAVDGAGPSGAVNNPALLTIAKNDLTATYIDLAGRTPVSTVPTELGGTTKTAGVYVSAATDFQITAGAGPLILDGQGDPNAIFIFQAPASAPGLTVGPGSTVSLINGAQACNVWWRVDSADINTTAVFKGNVLALNAITVANGANIEGRLLARNANVTLIADTVTRPVCLAATTTSTPVPALPNTGLAPKHNVRTGASWKIIAPIGIVALSSIYLVHRKRTA